MKAALVLVLVCSAAAIPSQGGESCLLGRPLCRVLADLAGQVDLVTREVERRTIHIGRIANLEEWLAVHEKRHLHTTDSEGGKPGEGGLKEAHQEIRQLKERLDSQEALYRNLLKAVEEIKKNEILPFDSNTEDNVLGNSNSNDGLSLLLTKVDRVENITSEVREELESERKVRRHLEEDLNATRHDVRMLNDKFEMAAIVNRTLFEDRNETRERDEDKVRSLHFKEELEYLRAIVTDLRENSTAAMTLGAARVNDLEERVTELTNASKGMDATMRRDVQSIQTQIGALAQAQLDERLTQSEIRNLTFEVLDQRMALISENLAIAEHRIDSLETATRHKLKDIDSKLRNVTHFWNTTHFWNATYAMAENVTKRLEGAVENASSYREVCSLPKATGPCRNFTLKWFFDIPYGGCSRFWYSGCDGNGNKFDTLEDCENACVKPEGPGVCFLPKTIGPCTGMDVPSWYYDVGSESCEAFSYGGCRGNNNRFKTKEACEQKCINLLPTAPEDTSCIDYPQFTNCELIVQTRRCKNKFYARYCCASCTKAGQLQSSAPQE